MNLTFLLSLNVCKLKTFDTTNATIFYLTFLLSLNLSNFAMKSKHYLKAVYYVWFMHISAQKCCGWGCGCRRMCVPPGVTDWPSKLMITVSTEWLGTLMITISTEWQGKLMITVSTERSGILMNALSTEWSGLLMITLSKECLGT